MKYTFTLFIIFFIGISLSAQKDFVKSGEGVSIDKLRPINYRSGEGVVLDTLFPPIFAEECANTVVSFEPTDGWGYVSGTNNFMDLEKAQKFSFEEEGMFSVMEVGVFFIDAALVGDGNLRAKIYSVNEETGGPGELLGTSNDLKASEVVTDDEELVLTLFNFDMPAAGSGDAFFVSIDFADLYTTNDTVGIFLSDVDCGSGEDAWEFFGDQWVRMFDSWGGLESDLFMAVVVDFQGSTSTNDISETLSVTTYPSPASDVINVNYSLKDPSTVLLEVYSLDGKRVVALPQGRQSTGTHNIQLQVDEWESGTYLTRISTDKGVFTGKAVVLR